MRASLPFGLMYPKVRLSIEAVADNPLEKLLASPKLGSIAHLIADAVLDLGAVRVSDGRYLLYAFSRR